MPIAGQKTGNEATFGDVCNGRGTGMMRIEMRIVMMMMMMMPMRIRIRMGDVNGYGGDN